MFALITDNDSKLNWEILWPHEREDLTKRGATGGNITPISPQTGIHCIVIDLPHIFIIVNATYFCVYIDSNSDLKKMKYQYLIGSNSKAQKGHMNKVDESNVWWAAWASPVTSETICSIFWGSLIFDFLVLRPPS